MENNIESEVQEQKKPKAPKSAKRQKGDLIKQVRELTNPERLRIPKKNPTLQYRWLRNNPDNLGLMEAKGYRVATADEVRAAGLKPSADGSCRYGDLVLGVEEMRHHKAHRDAEAELRKRQNERLAQGVRKSVRAGGFTFDESVRQT